MLRLHLEDIHAYGRIFTRTGAEAEALLATCDGRPENEAMRLDPVLADLVDELRGREAAARARDRALQLDERRTTRERVQAEVDEAMRKAAAKRHAHEELWLTRQRIQELGRLEESRLRALAAAALSSKPDGVVAAGRHARAEAERLQRDLSPTQPRR